MRTWAGTQLAAYERFRQPPHQWLRHDDIAAQQGLFVLTRNRELLKRRIISHGCYMNPLKPSLQLRELCERIDQVRSVQPFILYLLTPCCCT